MKELSRRDFILDTGKLAGALCLGCAGMLAGCKGPITVQHTYADKKITVRIADFADNKYVLVASDKLPAPIYLCKLPDGKYSAVLMQCTHQQCELRPYGEILHCPCHGSEFSNTGLVLQSPASEPLPAFKVSADNTFIYIE